MSGNIQHKSLNDKNGRIFFSTKLSEDQKYLYARWEGDIDEEKLQLGVQFLIDQVGESKVSLLLNDNSELKGSWVGFNDWLESEIGPRLYQAGLRKIAHIVSPYFITKFSAVDLETRDMMVVFRVFDNRDKAISWLTS